MRRGWVVAAAAVLLTTLTACSGSTGGTGEDTTTRSAATSPPATSPPVSSPSAHPTADGIPARTPGPQKSAEPGPAEREQRLDAQTNGQPHVVVTVPGGYEAATYDQKGSIYFWGNGGGSTSWRQIGRSHYPSSSQVGPPDASVSGALLQRMTHATFIVRGAFTGDGSGNAVAFTTGSKGWGAIKAESSGNIGPSGRAVGNDLIGLSYDFAFVGARLQTKDCPTDRPVSDCGSHPVTKVWMWTGKDFRLA